MEESNQTKEHFLKQIKLLEERVKELEEDASKHKKAGDVLRSSEGRFRSIIEKNRDGIVILDKDKNIVFANPSVEDILGRRGDDLLGKEFGIDIGAEATKEIEISHKNGEKIIIEMHSAGIEWERKRCSLVSMRNVTARNQIQKFRVAVAELKKIDHLKDEFIGTVSHELRTPLTVIREGVSLLKDKVLGEVNDKQADILSDVMESVSRLAKIINDLLDISKLESGKMKLLKSEVDISVFIQQLAKEFKLKTEQKEINIEVDLPQDLPHLYGDRNRIIQVLTNLIGNAIKFTPREGLVTISARDMGDFVEISVSDTGIGISEENISKLFDKFEQFGRATGPGEHGTGLGLAISKNIVELHDGNVWVNSELGKGTSFCFTIPKYEDPEIISTKIINKKIKDISAREGNKDLSIIIIQLVNIDKIRESLGEDACKKAVSSVLSVVDSKVSRLGDTVLPYHFGKILLMLPNTDEKGAKALCANIKDALDSSKIEYGEQVFIHAKVRFAVASYVKSGTSAEELLRFSESEFRRRKKILIVDDHPQIVRLLSYRLKSEDRFDLIQAFNGEEAVEKAFNQMPDLVICDIVMPKMSGYEVLGCLKGNEKTKDIPFIILTAHQVKTERIEAIAPGSVPILAKSDGFETLMKLVNNLI